MNPEHTFATRNPDGTLAYFPTLQAALDSLPTPAARTHPERHVLIQTKRGYEPVILLQAMANARRLARARRR